MKNAVRLLCCLMFLPFCLIGQAKDTGFIKNTWHDYEGKIGKSEIQMSLFFFENGDIKGNYVYKKYDKKILVVGTYRNNEVYLTELMNGNPNGYFISKKWDSYSSNYCEGTWTDSNQGNPIKFTMQSTGYGGQSYDHRYPEVDSDVVLENFMKHVKESIIKGDKDWIANNIEYPIKAYKRSKIGIADMRIEIKNKEELIKQFDLIFIPSFKAKIKSDVASNIWGNNQGYMLGNGDIWVNLYDDKIKIAAINN